MKKKLFVLSLFAALFCQSFLAAESSCSQFKEEVETLLSDLDSAESSLEKNLIRKKLLKSNLDFLAQQLSWNLQLYKRTVSSFLS